MELGVLDNYNWLSQILPIVRYRKLMMKQTCSKHFPQNLRKWLCNPPVAQDELWQCGAGCAWRCQLWGCSPPGLSCCENILKIIFSPPGDPSPAHPPFPSLHLLPSFSENSFLHRKSVRVSVQREAYFKFRDENKKIFISILCFETRRRISKFQSLASRREREINIKQEKMKLVLRRTFQN